MKTIIYSLLILLIFGCNPNRQLSEETKSIDFNSEGALSNREGIYIDSLIIIPLETSDESLITSIAKIETFDSLVYIQTNDRILSFDMSGKFIRNYGNKGRGVGEYMRINTFTIDRKEKTILILDEVLNGIHRYSVDGKYLSSQKVYNNELNMCYFGVQSSDNSLFFANLIHWNRSALYSNINLDKLAKKSYLSSVGMTSKSGETFGYFPITNTMDTIKFIVPFDPTVYTFAKTVSSLITFSPVSPVIDTIQLNKIEDLSIMTYAEFESNGYFTGFTGITETKKYMLLDVMFGSRYFLYDKEKRQGALYNYSIDEDLEQMPLINIRASNRDCFIGVGEIFRLKGLLDNLEECRDTHLLKLREAIKKMNDDDNPLLLFYKIK